VNAASGRLRSGCGVTAGIPQRRASCTLPSGRLVGGRALSRPLPGDRQPAPGIYLLDRRPPDRQRQHADALPAAEEAALGPGPPASDAGTDHPRRAHRTIKTALAPAWIEVVGAAQVAQLRRTVTRKGRKTVEVVYLITSDAAAGPATLASWVRSHWEIENKPL
jgi:hypothetical protein